MRLSNKSTNFAILASILFTLRVYQHTPNFVGKGGPIDLSSIFKGNSSSCTDIRIHYMNKKLLVIPFVFADMLNIEK